MRFFLLLYRHIFAIFFATTLILYTRRDALMLLLDADCRAMRARCYFDAPRYAQIDDMLC